MVFDTGVPLIFAVILRARDEQLKSIKKDRELVALEIKSKYSGT